MNCDEFFLKMKSYLLFKICLGLFDKADLFVDHIMDALAHGTMPLLSPLRLLMPMVPLLGAECLALPSVLHLFLVLKVLFLVSLKVLLNIRGNFGQILQLLAYLRVDFIQVVQFHADFVNLNLRTKRSARVPTLDGRPKAAPVTISGVNCRSDRRSDRSLATLRGLRMLIRH